MIVAAKAAVASSAVVQDQVLVYSSQVEDLFNSVDGSTYTILAANISSSIYAGACYLDDDVYLLAAGTSLKYSTDKGASFNNATIPTAQTVQMGNFKKQGSVIACTGVSGTSVPFTNEFVWYSTNQGATWTANNSNLGNAGRAAITYGTEWFAVGDLGSAKIADVTTGSWTAVTTGITAYFGTYGNGLYVVVGTNGALRTSPDLVTWTARTSQFSTSVINCVATDGTNFVAVGASGKISDSTDGITWTARTSGTSDEILRVAYSTQLGKWFAVGRDDTLLYSSDRVTWTAVTGTIGSTDDFQGLATRS